MLDFQNKTKFTGKINCFETWDFIFIILEQILTNNTSAAKHRGGFHENAFKKFSNIHKEASHLMLHVFSEMNERNLRNLI